MPPSAPSFLTGIESFDFCKVHVNYFLGVTAGTYHVEGCLFLSEAFSSALLALCFLSLSSLPYFATPLQAVECRLFARLPVNRFGVSRIGESFLPYRVPPCVSVCRVSLCLRSFRLRRRLPAAANGGPVIAKGFREAQTESWCSRRIFADAAYYTCGWRVPLLLCDFCCRRSWRQ